MIYLDNAATTLMKPPAVPEAVLGAFGHLGNAGRGVNSAALDASRSLFSAREAVAELFHAARPQQVAFTLNVTQALNMAIQGLCAPGDRIVTTAADHNSVLRPCRMMRDQGAEVEIVPCDKQGCLDWQAMENLVGDGTRMLVMTQASNVTGNVYDIRRAAKLAHSRGALFVLDSAQSAGHIEINMEALGIDVLCFTGHKGLYG
ncbi:MAG: aminotransferase class V-fold PLP-dependent enzyme, partial [Clostridia bacterium]|nr:aminotransferase class V-fold PLP-dependent enzyme [Clostridia bacterium]